MDAVKKLQRRLAGMPDYKPRLVTKTEAVRLLLPEIHSMQKRGYSLSAIAGFLSEDGVGVSVMTLKATMKHAGERKRRKKRSTEVPALSPPLGGREVSTKPERRAAASNPETKAVVHGGAGPAPRASDASAPEGSKKKDPEGALVSPTRPNAERPKEVSPTPAAATPRRSSFVVREDTEDL
jgi:hypothetical protein